MSRCPLDTPPPPLPPLAELPEWARLSKLAKATTINPDHLRIIQAAGLSIDLSAQHHSPKLQAAIESLLTARHFADQRERLFQGDSVNLTEGRAAWHTALRTPAPTLDEITSERQRVNAFIRNADTERHWRHVVHIGIGGSDWGVRLAVRAFGYTGTWRDVRFVANIDGHAIEGGLAGLNPHQTLVVLASKSFTTTETLENGRRALQWLKDAGVANPTQHFIAVTAMPQRAESWGISENHIFKLWDWVGGRYSIWSSISITAALAVNSDVIAGMQNGAAAMDNHFLTSPIADHAPVPMAMAGVINRSILGYGSLNIAPYDSRLAELVPYIQQLEMESLGKSVRLDGSPAQVPTGPAVWGMPGTDAQHTFFQWLHQSSEGAPVDFIIARQADHHWPTHHQHLLANCLAQREALLRGRPYARALAEAEAEGHAKDHAAWLAHHRTYKGGRPSTLVVLSRLSPYTLGALLALYEHKVFVQALVWGINPFDQWGVEYGKGLAKAINQQLSGHQSTTQHDASTNYWIAEFQNSLKPTDRSTTAGHKLQS